MAEPADDPSLLTPSSIVKLAAICCARALMPSLLDPDVLVKAFTPFAVRERAELEKYVRRVQDLERATFFTAKELTWNLPLGGDPQPRTWGDDALSAALSTMRQLWMPDEDGGFHRVRRMLEEHAAASGSPEGERAWPVGWRAGGASWHGRFYMRFAAGPRAILASPDLLS